MSLFISLVLGNTKNSQDSSTLYRMAQSDETSSKTPHDYTEKFQNSSVVRKQSDTTRPHSAVCQNASYINNLNFDNRKKVSTPTPNYIPTD